EFVVRIVHRQTVTHAGSCNQTCLLGHSVHGRQSASRQYIPTQTGKDNTEWKAEKEQILEMAQVVLNWSRRPRNLNNEFPLTEHRLAAHDAPWRIELRNRYDLFIRFRRKFVAAGYWMAQGFGRCGDHFPCGTQYTQPGTVILTRFKVIGRNNFSMGIMLHHVQGPIEIASKLIVQKLGHVVADEIENQQSVDGKHNNHCTNVGNRQSKTHAPGTSQCVHGSPSRNMKPIPRMV